MTIIIIFYSRIVPYKRLRSQSSRSAPCTTKRCSFLLLKNAHRWGGRVMERERGVFLLLSDLNPEPAFTPVVSVLVVGRRRLDSWPHVSSHRNRPAWSNIQGQHNLIPPLNTDTLPSALVGQNKHVENSPSEER